MGRASIRLIEAEQGFQLVGAVGKKGASYIGKDVSTLNNSNNTGILIKDELNSSLANVQADVLLEFTVADSAFEHAKLAIEKGIRPVVGTSGLKEDKVQILKDLAKKHKVGALIIPNFSLGAVLMMEFAKQAGEHFANVEIVEMHHTEKHDAPSGTAMYTAKKLAEAKKNFNIPTVDEKELVTGARGGQHSSGVRIHSLRLPGLISHQEVIFGGPGELLKIKHDSFNVDCFTNGIKMSLNAVMQLNELVVGLENILPNYKKAPATSLA